MLLIFSWTHKDWGGSFPAKQFLINPKVQFCYSRNVVTFYIIYLRFILYVFKVCFILCEEPAWLDVIIFDEVVFFKKSAHKKRTLFEFALNWLSYVSFFLVLCLTALVTIVTFITLLLSQVYIFTNSYQLWNVPCKKWWRQQDDRHNFKTYILIL